MAQNFENHTRFMPLFHFVVMPLLLLNLIWSIVRVVRQFSAESVVSLILAITFVLLALAARLMAVTVQDRLIRLEMRLRLARLLPPDLQARANDLTVSQYVSLRFASDEELPALTRKVLAENLTDRKAIKRLVKNWQADLLRA
jgi:hypothetical protein